MTLETAAAFSLLAIVIVALSLLLNGFDYFKSDNESETYNEANASQPNQNYSHPVAAAIASYDQKRDAQERERAGRERTTIRVLTGTGIFAAAAATAAFASVIITSQQAADFRDQEQRQLRAYAYIFPVSIVVFKPNAAPSALLSMKNYGITPIRQARFDFGFNVVPPNADSKYEVPERLTVTSKQVIPVPPTGSNDAVPIRLEGGKPISQSDFENATERAYVLVLKETPNNGSVCDRLAVEA